MKSRERKQADEQKLFEQLYQSVTKDGKLLYPGRLLQRAAQKFPNFKALIYHDQFISYQELYNRATLFSHVIREKGVKPRDRVLLCFENSPEFYVSYFAIWQAGAVVIPLNTFFREKEIAHVIADADPAMIITTDKYKKLFQEQMDGIPLVTEHDMHAVPAEQLLEEKIIELDSDEMIALLYTSGTTGLPKGVMLSGRNIVINMLQTLARLGFAAQERVFGVLPFFHIFAQNTCVWTSIFMGVTVIVVPKIDRRYITEGLQHKPTIFLGVPALYGLLCLLRPGSLDSVKLFVSGGDALPDKIRALFGLVYRRKICNGYGLTETSPVISADLADITGKTNNVGKPVVGIFFSIRDQQGNDLLQGAIGQLWVKGDNVMLGYYRAAEATAAVMKNGWFSTGDLAYIDAKGNIVITGREKDVIIHKGLNIYPQEIENVILMNSNVLRVGVIGKKDEMVGEIPIAFVQLWQKEEGIEQTLKELCRQYLASYKVPRLFICQVKELPTTATGKVDKKILRALKLNNE
ncbi:MAG: AMP-binding protein [Candidatus Babeliales bacterium]